MIKTITAHKLRKVFGTDLARKNVNPFIIGRLLRHKDIRVTCENYIRNNIENLKLTVINSTQEEGEFILPEEMIDFFVTHIDANSFRKAKFLTIAESGAEFTLTIKKN